MTRVGCSFEVWRGGGELPKMQSRCNNKNPKFTAGIDDQRYCMSTVSYSSFLYEYNNL